jgi:hypothetical protein
MGQPRPKRDRRPQTIYRNASARKPFTAILNSTLQDAELSPAAGWVLMLVLSLPLDWEVHLGWIAERRKIGRDRVRAAVGELETRKYCKRVRTRKKDGTLGSYAYNFTDEPGAFDEPGPEKPSVVTQQNRASPQPEKPAPVKPPPTKETSPTKETVSHKKAGSAPMNSEQGQSSGDALIPFSSTDLEQAVEESAEREARAETGIREDVYLRVSTPAFRAVCHKLCVEPVPILKRFLEKTRGKKIRRQTAYLIRMAQEEAAALNGISVADLVASTDRDMGRRAAAMAAAVEPDELRRKSASARTPNGSALKAALKSGARA